MADTNEIQAIGQSLATALTNAYQAAAAGSSHLVFLPFSVDVPDAIVQSGLVNPVQMQTWLEINFDSPFIVSPDDFSALSKDPSHGSASRIYTVAASSAQSTGDPDSDAWKRRNMVISGARSALGPDEEQKTIIPQPDDFVLPDKADYWTSFDSTQASQTQTTTTTKPVNVDYWRVRNIDPQIIKAVINLPPAATPAVKHIDISPASLDPAVINAVVSGAQQSSTRVIDPKTVLQVGKIMNMSLVRAAAPAETVAVNTQLAAKMNISSTAKNEWMANSRSLVISQIDASAVFDAAAAVKTVTTTSTASVTVHLEHQCVTLGYYRSGVAWWDGVFLADQGWYIPGMARGALLPQAPGSAGTTYGLPMAMIVVRNLTVTGRWSNEAAAALSAPGGTLGPLSLFGAKAVAGTDGLVSYSHPGMQVVALLCSSLPVLPPIDAPPS